MKEAQQRESSLDQLAIPLTGKRIVREAVNFAPVRRVTIKNHGGRLANFLEWCNFRGLKK